MSTTALGTPLTNGSIRSVNFFNGRLLTGKDLSDEQRARRAADAQVGAAVGPGIAAGLEVAAAAGSPAGRVLVTRGLALAASGHALMLGADATIRLVQSAETVAAGSAGDFGLCPGLADGSASYVAGDGLFLLTLAPLLFAEGSAPVLALDPVNARCSTDRWVDAVQLRLLRIDDAPFGITPSTSLATLRNEVAYTFLRETGWQGAQRNPGTPPLPGPAVPGLTDCDVALAVVYMVGDAIRFVDAWAVRRRIGAAAASEPWSAWLGGRTQALAEARLLQFQAQTAEAPALLGAPAADALHWLPPAGFLPPATDWARFLGARAPGPDMAVASGDVADILAGALGADAIDLRSTSDETKFRVYRIGGSSGPLLFVRDARNVHCAEQVWLDGTRAGLPGADDVQTAIDRLRAGSCLHRVLRPDQRLSGNDATGGIAAGSNVVFCFEPGLYPVGKQPLRIHGLGRVRIHGHGARLVASDLECALLVESCDSVEIDGLDLQGGLATMGKDSTGIGLYGALTVFDTPRIRISAVRATCTTGTKGLCAAAIVAGLRPNLLGKASPPEVDIADCELAVGGDQQGILVLNPGIARLRRNTVVAGDEKGLAMQRGIVVAGSVAGWVQIDANLVRGAVRGIAVGVSDAKESTLSAERVQIERNVVEVQLAEKTSGDRYGLFTGNARAVTVAGNQVTRGGKDGSKLTLHGLRLSGRYGPHVVVRENLFDGPQIGVAFQPADEVDSKLPPLWVFRDNAAAADELVAVVQIAEKFQPYVVLTDNRHVPRLGAG